MIIKGGREGFQYTLGLLLSFAQGGISSKDWRESLAPSHRQFSAVTSCAHSVPPTVKHLRHRAVQPKPPMELIFYYAKNFLLSMKVVLWVNTLSIPFPKFLLSSEKLLWTLQKTYIENRTGRRTETVAICWFGYPNANWKSFLFSSWKRFVSFWNYINA